MTVESRCYPRTYRVWRLGLATNLPPTDLTGAVAVAVQINIIRILHRTAPMACTRPATTLLVLVLALARAALAHVVDLGSETWTLVNGNGSISLNTTLPAYPLEVLHKQGVIEDPMWR